MNHHFEPFFFILLAGPLFFVSRYENWLRGTRIKLWFDRRTREKGADFGFDLTVTLCFEREEDIKKTWFLVMILKYVFI